jgi:DNA-binding response OmpR family regulator
MTAASAPDHCKGKRVLVVEDEALIAMQIEFDLTNIGIEVIGPVASVRDALDLLKHESVDAAVLDFRLENETSVPIAMALVARQAPFLFMTGYSRNDLPSEWRQEVCLQKPVLLRELISTLGAIMQQPATA